MKSDQTGYYHMSLTSGEGEPITLEVRIDTAIEATDSRSYEFIVDFERHDYVRAMRAGDERAAAWSVQMPKDQWGRVEIYPAPELVEEGVEDDWYLSRSVVSWADECRSFKPAWTGIGGLWAVQDVLGGRSGLDGDSVVWTHGLVGHHSLGPPADVEPTVPFWDGWSVPIESPTGGMTVHVGHAWATRNLGLLGWVVWDGPEMPTIDNRTASATWLTLEDFDESGRAVQVGAYAEAWNVSKRLDLRDDPDGTRFVYVDATTPAITGSGETGRRETVMEVTPPAGDAVVLEDDVFGWAVPDGLVSGEPGAPPGEWEFRVRQLSGGESDHIRVAMVHWGIPPDCGDDGSSPVSGAGPGDAPADGSTVGDGETAGETCNLACRIAGSLRGTAKALGHLLLEPVAWLADWV